MKVTSFSVEWKSKLGQFQSKRMFSKEPLLENYTSYDIRKDIGNGISKAGEDAFKTMNVEIKKKMVKICLKIKETV